MIDCYKKRESEILQKKLLICHETEGCCQYGELTRAVRVQKKQNQQEILFNSVVLAESGVLVSARGDNCLFPPFWSFSRLPMHTWRGFDTGWRQNQRISSGETSKLLMVLKYLQHTVPCVLPFLVLRFYLSLALTFTRTVHAV